MSNFTWNYRVVREHWSFGKDKKKVEGWNVEIRECYYEKKNSKVPTSWADRSVPMVAESLKDLVEHHAFVAEAFKAPVLELKNGKMKEVKC